MSDEGFLGRWSRRKLDAKHGGPQQERPPELPTGPAAATAAQVPDAADPPSPEANAALPTCASEAPVRAPPPTLQDVENLNAESDFTRFTAADVAPEVKNAALKKLFADPRYNVMDGLDVYTGDYATPDPIPAAMLRQLASARFLGLFRETDGQQEGAAGARDDADNPNAQKVAQSESLARAVPQSPRDADADLQLQQDHAAPGKDPGRGIG
ncbi:MAG: DUF3306 domain-containing protein [Ramlibacter sp.]|nr:DUF3306 domain-containing protein [Ramlibacter sp.]